MYNALVVGLTLTGVPAGNGVSLFVVGEGFISFPASLCTFTLLDTGELVYRPLVSITATVSVCYFFYDTPPSPAPALPPSGRRLLESVTRPIDGSQDIDGSWGASDGQISHVYPYRASSRRQLAVTTAARTWQVDTNLNGLQREPTLFSSPRFTEYNVHDVKLSHIQPAAGPLGRSAVLTIHGNGFKMLGEGQLVCKVGGEVQVAQLLDSQHMLCSVAAQSSSGNVPLSVSLNNATNGTLTPEQNYT